MRGRPLDHSGDEVYQSVHEVSVCLETRVGYVNKRRNRDVEQEGCEYAPSAKALLHIVPTVADTFCITRIHSISTMGVGKERRIKNCFMMKPEKAAPVIGTALRTTGPVPVDSQQ